MPWLTVRRVAVQVSTVSGQASLIKFEGGVKAGMIGRISTSPLSEWHAFFGIISDGKKEHMILAGVVGDFTKSLVTNLQTYMWVRRMHFAGLPYLVNMYDKVLLVATGELSKTLVSGYPKDKVRIHDTCVLGRPNLSYLSVNAAKDWGAEVVMVTSNPEGSRDVVNACKVAGIASFGPIWDS
ncbi:hypothetical protein TanjilG_26551 [Lupinus angustifolius]|uniref:Uncharacterized protein n=1 Tax=Lupinus angustifolius TaxID=3871 RepID=A0A4P1QQ22_LUPAN|nr:hypothetical protein TanjilG_26551 [Lupinus angustifolius]